MKRDLARVSKALSREFVLNIIRNRKGFRPQNLNTPKGELVIASYNVHKCVGLDKRYDPERTINVIKELNADILALQEADKRFGERIGLIDRNELKEKTGLEYIPIEAMSKYGLGWHGNALFLKDGMVDDITQINLPGIEPRGAIIVEMRFKGYQLRVVAAHFGLLKRSRRLQVQTILDILADRPVLPTVMIGDLNEWRLGKSSSLKSLSPLFDVRLGSVPSFPARFPIFALDRIFFSPADLITSIQPHLTPLSRIASDHLPVKAHLDLASAHQTLKKSPQK